MQVKILKNAQKLGQAAAEYSAKIMKDKIAQKGCARIVMSTGASQFDTIKALVEQNVDWSKVTMFHLDEYVDLPETHPASFRRYLKERFISKVDLKAYHLVTGEGDIHKIQ